MQMAAINVRRPHWRVALLSEIKTHMIVSLQRGKLISTGKKKKKKKQNSLMRPKLSVTSKLKH